MSTPPVQGVVSMNDASQLGAWSREGAWRALAATVIISGLVIIPLLVVGLCLPSKYLHSEELEAPWPWPGGPHGLKEAGKASWDGDPVMIGPRGREGMLGAQAEL